jgi:hypothetical protein
VCGKGPCRGPFRTHLAPAGAERRGLSKRGARAAPAGAGSPGMRASQPLVAGSLITPAMMAIRAIRPRMSSTVATMAQVRAVREDLTAPC